MIITFGGLMKSDQLGNAIELTLGILLSFGAPQFKEAVSFFVPLFRGFAFFARGFSQQGLNHGVGRFRAGSTITTARAARSPAGACLGGWNRVRLQHGNRSP